ncbi:MAG TPA: hypothetical protein VIM05_00800 [Gaiellaceae bacterium]
MTPSTLLCEFAMVELYELAGLEVCTGCWSPFCRECGEHTTFAATIADDWPEPGFVCSCGWRIGWPAEGEMS